MPLAPLGRPLPRCRRTLVALLAGLLIRLRRRHHLRRIKKSTRSVLLCAFTLFVSLTFVV
jgi:hypothetical protein